MRRLPALLLAAVLALGASGLPSTSAGAQTAEPGAEPLPVVLRLRSQPPWNGADRPLRLVLSATNTGPSTLEALSLVLSIQAPARSRSVYELSLRADATALLDAELYPQEGVLEPGQTRAFRLRHPLDLLEARAETAIYPLKVEILAGDTVVGVLRTPLIYLAEPPEVLLNVAWTWVLTAPLEHGPDGTFLSGTLESDVAPGGRLSGMAKALSSLGPAPVDLAVSPLLIEQLAELAGGYRVLQPDGTVRTVPAGTGRSLDAARTLQLLRAAARRLETELVSVPYADPSIPALRQTPLARDLRVLLDRGRGVVQSTLGSAPRRDLLWPPGGQLDGPSVGRLVRLGVRTLVLPPHFLPAAAGEPFTPGPVVRLVGGGRAVDAVVPDEEVATLLPAYAPDPRLAAQVILGKLAATWLEFPGLPGRGVALTFTGDPSVPPSFYRLFVRRVRGSPWLRPVTVSTMVATTTERRRQPVPARTHPAFNPVFVARLLQARATLAQFARTAQPPPALLDRLRKQLLLAEAGTFLRRPDLGLRFVEAVEGAVEGAYTRVRVRESVLTLTSREGVLPVQVRNDSGFTFRVRVRLLADRRIAFPEGNTRLVVLPPEDHVFTFPVRAETTGRFPVRVQLLTPGSPRQARVIAQADVLVRSTAYNRVALLLTVGAAVFLVAWWGRRFLPRPRS
ncbi:MAG TPA: DUF6049 family protein [Actinomycetota bacterium]|nr:DUF6049 family protein [Actinomycetota bacterium]